MSELLKKLDKEIRQIEDAEKKAEALERLKAIARAYEGEDEVLPWDRIIEARKLETVRIMSGWPTLDDLLKGFRPQQLIVVSAATKSGKTSFMVDLTSRLMSYKPLWLPFEEGVEELVEKFEERSETAPQFVSPQSMKSGMKWVEEKIVESIAKYDSKIVVIDHLDFIVPFGGDNRSDRIGQTMRDLKGLAKKWNIVIFLICHLVKTEMTSQPTLEDLRGSASIAQEADTVLLLWREVRKEKGEVLISSNLNVSVQAARRGRPGNVKMVFRDGRFFEEDWRQTDADREFDKKW